MGVPGLITGKKECPEEPGLTIYNALVVRDTSVWGL